MAWVRFTKDFSWKPTSQSTVSFRAGSAYNVKADTAAEAIRRGAAVKVEKKSKDSEAVEVGQKT